MCNFRRTQRIKSAAPDAASASGLGCSGGRNRIPFGWLGQRRPAGPARSPPWVFSREWLCSYTGVQRIMKCESVLWDYGNDT